MLFVYTYLLGFRLVFDASFHLFSSLYLCCFGAVVINLRVQLKELSQFLFQKKRRLKSILAVDIRISSCCSCIQFEKQNPEKHRYELVVHFFVQRFCRFYTAEPLGLIVFAEFQFSFESVYHIQILYMNLYICLCVQCILHQLLQCCNNRTENYAPFGIYYFNRFNGGSNNTFSLILKS